MLEIAKVTIGYIERQYDGNNDFASSSKEKKGVKVDQPEGSSDRGKDNNKALSEVDLMMASEKGAERSREVSTDKAPATLSPCKSSKAQPVIDFEQQPIETSSSSCGKRTTLPWSVSGSSRALKEGTGFPLTLAMPNGEEACSHSDSSLNASKEL